MSDNISQHKRMAMGEKPGFKKGGLVMGSNPPAKVPSLKTGMRDTPMETAKRNNGIPGMKKGGKC